MLFGPLENILKSAQEFIFGRPILFILVSGLAATFWSVLSESVTYWAARLGGRPLVTRLSRWLGVDLRHVERAEAMFVRWGVGLILFGRIFPGLRTLVSVPAGTMRMNFGLFFSASLGGAYVWNTLLVGVGYFLGIKL